MKNNLEISLLAFDLNKVNKQLKEIKDDGIKFIHYDVMDKTYSKTNGFNGEYLKEINDLDFSIHLHLMASSKIYSTLKKFSKYKIKAITFQFENLNYFIIKYNLFILKRKKILAGLAIRPTSKPIEYKKYLNNCEIITIMGVNPGAGGQKFQKETDKNISFIFNYRKENDLNYKIELDGGITTEIIKKYKNKIDFFISGSFYMNADKKEKLKILKEVNENDK